MGGLSDFVDQAGVTRLRASGGGGGVVPVGASVPIPQQTVVGGSGQLTLSAATWDTSGFLAGNELDFPAGESGVYVWGAEIYATQPENAGAYMNFQVRTNGAPVNLQAALPLVGTGNNAGAGISSVGVFVGDSDGIYVQANNAGGVDMEILNGVLFLYRIA